MFKNYKIILISLTSIFLISCLGVEGEGLYERFKGISSVEQLSPYAVKLNWLAVKNVEKYEIFISTSDAPIGVTSNTEFLVSNLEPNRQYIFAVNAVYFDGREEGISFEKNVIMWEKFKGVLRGEIVSYDKVDLFWDYKYDNVRYYIYYAKINENINFNNSKDSTTANQIRISGLTGDTSYKFVVRASFPDGTTDDNINVLVLKTNVGISPMPVISINKVTMGNLPSVSIKNSLTTYLIKIFKKNNNTMVCEKKVNQTGVLCYAGILEKGFNELYATVTDAIGNTATIEGLSTVVKSLDLNSPSLRPSYSGLRKPFSSISGANAIYNDNGYNVVSSSSSEGHSNANNVKVGDFNCDGYEDLVLAVPSGTYDPETYCTNTSTINATTCQASSWGYFVIYYGSASGFKNEPDLIYSFQHEAEGSFYSYTLSSGGWGWSITVGNFNKQFHNGNSCDDLAISSNIHNYYGSVGIFYGSPNGLQVGTSSSDLVRLNIGSSHIHCSDTSCNRAFFTPTDLTRNGNNRFGAALASGDIDGDGFEDLVVGMYNTGSTNDQRVYIFFGSTDGIGVIGGQTRYIVIRNEDNKATINRFGANLALANLSNNSNNRKDLFITSHKNIAGVWQGSLIYIKSNIIKAIKDAGLNIGQNLYDLSQAPDIIYDEIGIHPNSKSISSIRKPSFSFIDSAGDVNGDGYEDIVIGVPDDSCLSGESGFLYSGSFYIIYGANGSAQITNGYESGANACDLSNNCKIQRIPNPDRTKTCPGVSGSYCYYAPRISSIDLNQDGFSDLLVSFPLKPKSVNDNLVGELHIYYGAQTGSSNIPRRLLPNKPNNSVAFNKADMFGYTNVAGYFKGISAPAQIISLAFKKDMVEEGYSEEITPMAYLISQRVDQGGNILTFSPIDTKAYDRSIELNFSKFENMFFDNLVFNLGDINGDGYDDVVMKGASYYPDTVTLLNSYGIIYYGSNIGLVSEYNSSCVSPSISYQEDINSLPCPQILNSKYISENLLGVHNNYFTYIVDGAGDVNGDGFDDIVSVGDGVYLFYGSSFGPVIDTAPNETPLFFTDPKIVNMGSGTGVLSSANFYKNLSVSYGYSYYGGYSKSNGQILRVTRGDFNGDGYSDIVFFSSVAGVIILYGSSSGIQSDGFLKIYNTDTSEGNILEADKLGTSQYPSQCEGTYPNLTCYGLRLLPSLNEECKLNYMDLNSCSTGYGSLLSLAQNLGDINGDGIDDLALVMPSARSDAQARFFIYYGSRTGLVANGINHPDNSNIISPQLIQLIDGGSTWYGRRNLTATAGDINGDGFNDLVIGGNAAGSAGFFVFYGGINGVQTFSENDAPNTYSSFNLLAAGLSKFSSFASCEGNPASGFHDTTCKPLRVENISLGATYTISGGGQNGTISIGDINGDGYSDILQTYANCYKNDKLHTGCVLIYFGSKYGLRTYNVSMQDGVLKAVNQLATASTTNSCNIYENFACSPLLIIPDISYMQITKFSYFLSGDYNGDGSSDLLLGSRNIFYNYKKSGPDLRLEGLIDKTSVGHLWYMYK